MKLSMGRRFATRFAAAALAVVAGLGMGAVVDAKPAEAVSVCPPWLTSYLERNPLGTPMAYRARIQADCSNEYYEVKVRLRLWTKKPNGQQSVQLVSEGLGFTSAATEYRRICNQTSPKTIRFRGCGARLAQGRQPDEANCRLHQLGKVLTARVM